MSGSAPPELLEFALTSAREAGRLLLEGWRRHHLRSSAGSGLELGFKRDADVVTEYDRAAESVLLQRITQRYPDHGVIAEEGGRRQEARPGAGRWLVDPLDGTLNFAHGLPYFAVSVAFEVDGELAVGVVHAPVLEQTFHAVRGAGAYCNGRPLRVSDTPSLDCALLVTGFPFDRRTHPASNNVRELAVLVERAQEVRRLGSAALDLCMVASGWLDGYWERKLQCWDIAAGLLIAREARARLSTYRGSTVALMEGEVVATNGLIHDELLSALGLATNA
jgi:myo-inositol-1(or 4)-monophosphatase